MRRGTVVTLLFLLFVTFGCHAQAPPKLHILVAASTRQPMQELAAAFEAETGIAVTVTADDSSKLAMQIVNGAPADLFLSANEKWADFVKSKGLVARATLILTNDLVLIVPHGNRANIRALNDIVRIERIALAGPTVPAGMYARQALGHFQLLDKLDSKIVNGENVRAALAFVERGEVDAGIVFKTDLLSSANAELVYTFPEESHDAIVYPWCLLTPARESTPATRFFEYAQAPIAREKFGRYGFGVLPPLTREAR